MSRIKNAPSGENTSPSGTEGVPLSGSQWSLLTTIRTFFKTTYDTLYADFVHTHVDSDNGGPIAHSVLTGAGTSLHVPAYSSDSTTYLNGDGEWTVPAGSGFVYDSDIIFQDITTGNADSDSHGFLLKLSMDTAKFLRADGSWQAPPAGGSVYDSDILFSDTTTNNASSDEHGFLPKLSGDSDTYLNGDGEWLTLSGGGAPTNANYVTTSANGTLSAEKVLPYLGNYNPDKAPTSPSSDNDEFDDDFINAAWTQINSPDSISESTYHGWIVWSDNETQTAGVGIRKNYSPGASTAFTIGVSLFHLLQVSFSSAYLAVETSVPTDIALIGIQNGGAGSIRFRSKNGASETNPGTYGSMFMGEKNYLVLQRDASDVYTLKYSNNGIIWHTISTFSNSGTVARVALLIDPQGGGSSNSSVCFDFIRFFTSVTDLIGEAP